VYVAQVAVLGLGVAGRLEWKTLWNSADAVEPAVERGHARGVDAKDLDRRLSPQRTEEVEVYLPAFTASVITSASLDHAATSPFFVGGLQEFFYMSNSAP
jgi:hypothetical protein